MLPVPAIGQADSVIAQLSNSAFEAFAGGISGNGRFIVFESSGNLATENPRNEDGNTEIFLFDYAQRRIFQITDTKSVLFNTANAATFNNIRITIVNTRPVISNDGRWIAFSSNATTARPQTPDSTNPGSFDGNAFTAPTPVPTPTPSASPTPTPSPTPTASPTPTPTPPANPLADDGNLEMWLYEIPAYGNVADLSAGDEIPLTQLAGGAFIRVTNTDPSQLPRPGTPTNGPFIAEDNHDASINDDGNIIAFVSTRDLVPSIGNPFPTEDNDEIFTYVRSISTTNQVTKTPRGVISNPIYNKNPTISGNGLRVAFASTGNNPVVGMTGGVNELGSGKDGGNNRPTSRVAADNLLESRNEEIFYADLNGAGGPIAGKQVTTTTPTNPGDPVNILDLGRRLSRDGRYIAFDSYADLAKENNGTNYTSFALYLYDAVSDTFRRIGPRSTDDTGAQGGDVAHFPGFTDYDANGTPQTLVFTSRQNFSADGTVPAAAANGLNPNDVRPSQLYSYPLNIPPAAAVFTRLANFPAPNTFIASTQLLTSNSLRRSAFNLALTELGTGNFDSLSEVFYFLLPPVVANTTAAISVKTGASGLEVIPAPTPSPTPSQSPTPTATPTPTPSPSPSPSPSGTPTPTPPPVTSPAIGVSPGSLAIIDYVAGQDPPIVPRTAVGSLVRAPTLPIELSGVSMSINGAAAGLKRVSQQHIEFVVPIGILSAVTGTSYPVVINNNGVVMKFFISLVPSQPDIFNRAMIAAPGGRAKLFNVTNTIQTTEPFVIRTHQRKGNRLVPSVLRLFLTGVERVPASLITIRIGDKVLSGANIKSDPVMVEPGIYTIDFFLTPDLLGAGDKPIVVTVNINGTATSSRQDDTSARVEIL
ncbi:hypothetical protein BH20ACI2_BH20ACI2_18760 [soil metagenome]